MIGTVYLVGAGPGDPGLLTLKAARLLETADVVVHDNLVSDAILDRLPGRVERICVAKETGLHTMDQDAINALLAERAQGGQVVVRLKGGDPFVFGRGGEEAEYLAGRGVPFEVVPGITSAFSVPAYAGIPVTYRGLAASVAVVTGRAGPMGEAAVLDWPRLAGADTIVMLMGVANQASLARALVDAGRSSQTPAAAIRWGTTSQQRVVLGTLATIGDRMRDANLRPPAVLIIGDVVSVRRRVQWAERRPLFGRRVLIPSSFPSPFTQPLERLGAEVLHVSPVELGPPSSWRSLDHALGNPSSFSVVVFTDDVGVAATVERLNGHGLDTRALAGAFLVAASSGASRALRAVALRSDAILEDDGFHLPPDTGDRPWLALGCPDAQRRITALLADRGVRTVTPSVCTMTTTKWRTDRLRQLLTSRPVHGVVFGDAVEVERLVGVLDVNEREALRSVALAAVGPSARAAILASGFESVITTADASPDALAEALAVGLGGGADDNLG